MTKPKRGEGSAVNNVSSVSRRLAITLAPLSTAERREAVSMAYMLLRVAKKINST